ncbi:MAG: S-methyl-5'-thioadenosine phosphorylase [Sphingomonas sanxanigenens]|uniref:S-methyl-5'-thioadenosine phosphorylase n=1 Tax=Sphingomonas sanxanigenens TaxID=397260 RepID=A0A2W5CB15_9SPHN|nr:MAG: S-methyl-5'-thioadenosine phosphorylase [Sphingomonas sanxanigenens]
MGGWTIGVLGGSGLYAIDSLEDAEWITIDSPWGRPSDQLLTGSISGVRFVFLPRHGRGHVISPSELNFRANIDVLKRAGCTDLLALSAVGSLREHLAPGGFAVVDQFVDRTYAREPSFFGSGLVAHVSLADPVCPRLSHFAAEAGRKAEAEMHVGATYVAIEGPQFSTRAESHLYRQWNCDVIGMTAMPEARLAREAELPYALVGMLTDYDCWREGEAHVDVETVLKVMHDNAEKARALVVELAKLLPAEREASPIDTCLDFALVTAPEKRDPALLAKLDAIAGRALG